MGVGGAKETMGMENGRPCDQEVPISIAINRSLPNVQYNQPVAFNMAAATSVDCCFVYWTFGTD
jgi:hypothetical protein